jgi:hypothetical protein
VKSNFAARCLFLAAAALALCANRPKPAPVAPPPPPPPAPVVVVIPPAPVPPLGAPASIVVPPIGVDGKRVTTNAGLNPDQIIWNLRSALNVAALDCLRPEHTEIVVDYRSLLRIHAQRLAAANRGVDSGFRARFGAGYVRQREAYLTKLYNFYAFPPTLKNFCDVALVVGRDMRTVPSAQLHNFAASNLPKLDAVFEDFYNNYAKYQMDLVAWRARYYPQTAPATTLSH